MAKVAITRTTIVAEFMLFHKKFFLQKGSPAATKCVRYIFRIFDQLICHGQISNH